MTERWTPVVGFEGFYEVSDFGRVRSIDRVIIRRNGAAQTVRSRLLKPVLRDGYPKVNLCKVGSSKSIPIYRLVLTSFIGPCPFGMECLHGNGNRLDSRLCNLRWGTRRENRLDSVAHGTDQNARKLACIRGHLLVEPNLAKYALRDGRRNCLSCARAYSIRRNARKNGRGINFQEVADRYYREIMEAGAS